MRLTSQTPYGKRSGTEFEGLKRACERLLREYRDKQAAIAAGAQIAYISTSIHYTCQLLNDVGELQQFLRELAEPYTSGNGLRVEECGSARQGEWTLLICIVNRD